jgi:hypothetical protein
MGTRSTISIQNSDGTVTGIYCHWDGYLDWNGRILNDHYQTEDQVRALIALGNISSLGDPDRSSETIAYARDRGGFNQEASTSDTWRRFINDHGQLYNYVFVAGEGWYLDKMNAISKLSNLLEKSNA